MKSNPVEQVTKEMKNARIQLEKEAEDLMRQRNKKLSQVKKIEIILSNLNNNKDEKSLCTDLIVESQMKKAKKSMDKLKENSVKITQRELMKCKQNTMVGTMYNLLQNRRMHYKQIIEELRKIGYTVGTKQPELNINSLLSRDDRFVRVGRGIYTANTKLDEVNAI